MDNVIEVVPLLRKHSELELQILNGNGTTVAMEQELEATVRRLASPPTRSRLCCRRRGRCGGHRITCRRRRWRSSVGQFSVEAIMVVRKQCDRH
jgi:hypothetical protein